MMDMCNTRHSLFRRLRASGIGPPAASEYFIQHVYREHNQEADCLSKHLPGHVVRGNVTNVGYFLLAKVDGAFNKENQTGATGWLVHSRDEAMVPSAHVTDIAVESVADAARGHTLVVQGGESHGYARSSAHMEIMALKELIEWFLREGTEVSRSM